MSSVEISRFFVANLLFILFLGIGGALLLFLAVVWQVDFLFLFCLDLFLPILLIFLCVNLKLLHGWHEV